MKPTKALKDLVLATLAENTPGAIVEMERNALEAAAETTDADELLEMLKEAFKGQRIDVGYSLDRHNERTYYFRQHAQT